MRERVLKYGTENLADHELVEMLLYYVVARGNTNGTAHQLLDTFGDLRTLLDTDPEKLMQVPGVGERTALMFKLLSEATRRYYQKEWTKKPNLSNLHIAVDFLIDLFAQKKVECFYVLCLDSNGRLNRAYKVAEGTIDGSTIYMRNVVDAALRFQSRSVILAHNHPGGTVKPSPEDVTTTSAIVDTLNRCGIKVRDHIIISGTEYLSFLETGIIVIKD